MNYESIRQPELKKPLRSSLVVLSVVGAFAASFVASADQDRGLEGWTKTANAAVDDVMTYPAIAARRGHSGRSNFRVTVDRAGDIIASDLVESYGKYSLKSAAQRVLKNVDFPAIPADYDGESLTFSLQLNYIVAGSAQQARALERATEVRGEAVPYASSGSIRILSASAD